MAVRQRPYAELGVIEAHPLVYAWKQVVSVMRTWAAARRAGEPCRKWYGVYEPGTEIVYAQTGCSDAAKVRAEKLVATMNGFIRRTTAAVCVILCSLLSGGALACERGSIDLAAFRQALRDDLRCGEFDFGRRRRSDLERLVSGLGGAAMQLSYEKHGDTLMDFGGDDLFYVPRGCAYKMREAINNREARIGVLMDVVAEARKVLANFDRADASVLDKTEWAGMRSALSVLDDFMCR